MPGSTAKKTTAKKEGGGVTSELFHRGLNEKRMAQRGGGGGKRMKWGEDQSPVPVQFFGLPTNEEDSAFIEIDQHQFQEDGKWWYVPCTGSTCPLCQSERDVVRKKHYRFMTNVYNLATRQVEIMEGPKSLSTAIFNRYRRTPAKFLKKVFDVTQLRTEPVSYQFELAEEAITNLRGKKPHDLEEYVLGALRNYYGEGDVPAAGELDAEDEDDLTDDELDLEDDDEEEDDDLDLDDDDEEEDEEDDDDLDDEDDDDLDDDDEDEDEDEPAPVKKATKKAPAAKKAATRRR